MTQEMMMKPALGMTIKVDLVEEKLEELWIQ
jgi:hypothetical protein